MPMYNSGEDMGMDSSYGGEDTVTKPAESIDQETAEADTTIVPNKILSPEGEPLKEGDEIVVEIVKVYGDESEIRYAPKKAGGEEISKESQEYTPAEDFAEMDKD